MWLYLPPDCVSSSLATAGSDSASESPVEPSLWCTSSGEHLPRPLSWRGWKTRPWRALLSGTTLAPSTASRGVASWIASLAAAPVRTSRLPESRPDSEALARDSGFTNSASLTKQGLLFSSGKTSGGQSEVRSTWLRQTLRVADSELRHALSALRMSARPTSETDSLSWPTPSATPYGSNQTESPGAAVRPSLQALAAMWPTPTLKGNHNAKGASPTSGDGLATAATQWSTPRASRRGVTKSEESRSSPDLATMAVRMFPTPAARDWRDRGHPAEHGRHTPSLPCVATNDAGVSGMALNPQFVEALMGLPSNWCTPRTESPCSGTASSPSKPQSLSSSAGVDSLEATE